MNILARTRHSVLFIISLTLLILLPAVSLADTDRILLKSGTHKEKIESNKQAIMIHPDDEKAYYNLGVAYGNSGMYQEAIEAFQQVIRINPDDADAHFALEQYKILKSFDPELSNELFNSINE